MAIAQCHAIVTVLTLSIGVSKLYRHNFEHNRYVQAFENYARIIGINWHNFKNFRHKIVSEVVSVRVNCPVGPKLARLRSLLIQPSSAVAERIFSILSKSFT